MKSDSIKILGIMSGTSLDGLDLALCDFYQEDHKTHFNLIAAETIPYQSHWKHELENACSLRAEDYFKLHHHYGKFIGENVNYFLIKHDKKAEYIASHGHTIFHQPNQGFTTQIGCGATIAATTGTPTVCDFRSLDVALKGQGAPLVPIGDRDLFYKHESCLNIGGIANISFTKQGITNAFDVCVANMGLNYLAQLNGKNYDENGMMAEKGNVSRSLLHQLLEIETNYQSLGREWFETVFLPVLNAYSVSVEDKLATLIEYCAIKISGCLNQHQIKSVLITGGGVYNFFLIERIRSMYKGDIEIPADMLIQFKEAIIFGYLGYLRIKHQTNTLQSVTGAAKNSVSGCIYLS